MFQLYRDAKIAGSEECLNEVMFALTHGCIVALWNGLLNILGEMPGLGINCCSTMWFRLVAPNSKETKTTTHDMSGYFRDPHTIEVSKFESWTGTIGHSCLRSRHSNDRMQVYTLISNVVPMQYMFSSSSLSYIIDTSCVSVGPQIARIAQRVGLP